MFTMLLTLISLVSYSTALDCWHTGQDADGAPSTTALVTSLRATHVSILSLVNLKRLKPFFYRYP